MTTVNMTVNLDDGTQELYDEDEGSSVTTELHPPFSQLVRVLDEIVAHRQLTSEPEARQMHIIVSCDMHRRNCANELPC